MSRIMDEMIKEYIAECAEKARYEVEKEMAQRMLKDNLPIEKISKYSGLSIEEVEKLKKEMNG